jgi:hypothetical protein
MKRWTGLRERYSRIKKNLKSPSGSGLADVDIKPGEVKMLIAMDFLKDVIVPRNRKTFSNVNQPKPMMTDYTDEIQPYASSDTQGEVTEIESDKEIERTFIIYSPEDLLQESCDPGSANLSKEENLPKEFPVSPGPVPNVKRKRSGVSTSSKVKEDSSELEETLKNYLVEKISSKRKKDDTSGPTSDPDFMFLQSILPHFKQVAQEDKLDCQLEILSIIRNYRKKNTLHTE